MHFTSCCPILIIDHNVVRAKAPSINRVDIIRLALVVARVLLRGRIYLHLRLYRVVPLRPFVYLRSSKEADFIKQNNCTEPSIPLPT